MITRKITGKGQTSIPWPVRAALRIGEGDELAYTIEGDRVVLTKAKREPIDDPFGMFHEWSSEADRRACGDPLTRKGARLSKGLLPRAACGERVGVRGVLQKKIDLLD